MAAVVPTVFRFAPHVGPSYELVGFRAVFGIYIRVCGYIQDLYIRVYHYMMPK